MIRLILLAIVFSSLVVAPASAYIDPGTGSYVFQILVAALFSGLYAIKLYWQKLKDYLTGAKKEGTPPEPASPKTPPQPKE